MKLLRSNWGTKEKDGAFKSVTPIAYPLLSGTKSCFPIALLYGCECPTKQIFDERLTNRMKMLYNIVYQTKNTPAQAEGGNMNE